MRPVTDYCRFVYLSLLLCLVMPFGTWAEEFPVESIHVEASGQTATEARSRAMSEAERKGFLELVTRLSDEVTAARLSQEKQRDISLMVQSVEVKNEKISASSYSADVKLTFSADQIRALLPQGGAIPTATETTEAPATLVLPLFTQNNQTVLLGRDNPWWEAWGRVQPGKGASFILPIGDLEDISLSSLPVVRAGDYNQLKPLADKYHTGGILVADAVYGVNPETQAPEISVTVLDLKPEGANNRSVQVTSQPGETLPELLAKAVNAVVNGVHNSAQNQAGEKLLVKISFSSLKEWQMAQQRLKSVSMVQKTAVERLAGRYAVVAVYSTAQPEAVPKTFEQGGFVFKSSDGMPLLRLAQ